MRFFLKLLLVAIPAAGGYWVYQKAKQPDSDEKQPGRTSKSEGSQPSSQPKSQSPPQKNAAAKQDGKGSDEQIIERLSQLDGVTSRVAGNLVEKGINSREELTKLSREELMEIKGIGPKRAEKILSLGD